MKTQKEIEDRIEIHNRLLSDVDVRLRDEQFKIIKNKELIRYLTEKRLEEQAAIVYLSWTLI